MFIKQEVENDIYCREAVFLLRENKKNKKRRNKALMSSKENDYWKLVGKEVTHVQPCIPESGQKKIGQHAAHAPECTGKIIETDQVDSAMSEKRRSE